jgi:hypothetical protein
MGKSQISIDHEPVDVRHCKQCDAELVPHARFCSVCGAIAKSDEVQGTPQEPEKHQALQKWRSIGKAISRQTRADDAPSSATVTNEAETLTDAAEEKDAFPAVDSVTTEDIDEETEGEKSYTQPHLSAVVAKIGRREEFQPPPASPPSEQERPASAGEAGDAHQYSIVDYDTMLLHSYAPVPRPLTDEASTEESVTVEDQPTSAMPQLAEGLEMSQTQRLPAIGAVGKKAADLPVEARDTQRMAAPVLSERGRVGSIGIVGIASVLWPLILIVAAIATALLIYVVPGLPIRPYVVLAFLIICPGMAVIRLLRLRDVAVEWTLAIALSIVLSAIVPTVQLYAHLWSPDVSMRIILGITVVGALAQFINPRSRAIKKVEPA